MADGPEEGEIVYEPASASDATRTTRRFRGDDDVLASALRPLPPPPLPPRGSSFAPLPAPTWMPEHREQREQPGQSGARTGSWIQPLPAPPSATVTKPTQAGPGRGLSSIAPLPPPLPPQHGDVSIAGAGHVQALGVQHASVIADGNGGGDGGEGSGGKKKRVRMRRGGRGTKQRRLQRANATTSNRGSAADWSLQEKAKQNAMEMEREIVGRFIIDGIPTSLPSDPRRRTTTTLRGIDVMDDEIGLGTDGEDDEDLERFGLPPGDIPSLTFRDDRYPNGASVSLLDDGTGKGEIRRISSTATIAAESGSDRLEGALTPSHLDGKTKRILTGGGTRTAPTPGPMLATSSKGNIGPRMCSSGRLPAPSPALRALLDRRRLPLVLDLDHTLLNSATFDDFESQHDGDKARDLLSALTREEAALDPQSRLLHRLDHLGMWTKLRPGVRSFLRQAALLFEIHINTAGSQQYAEQMRNLLDPNRELIKGTVVGLLENNVSGIGFRPTKKGLTGELAGSEFAALILDDTAAVWACHEENLIQCERYIFFPSACRQFGLSGPSLLERRRDESVKEGMLATAMKVLRRVHAEFFARHAARQALAAKQAREAKFNALAVALDDDENDACEDVDVVHGPEATPSGVTAWASAGNGSSGVSVVGGETNGGASVMEGGRDPYWPTTVPEILAEERRRVLAGVELVFSRVFPMGSEAREHQLWRLAEQFGAKCGTTPGPSTTHVVAMSWGTKKTAWAAERGKHVVLPQWVECSVMLWKKADERMFPVRS